MDDKTLFGNVTNAFSRNALTKRFLLIVAATNDPTKGFLVLPVEDVTKLSKADPTLIEVAASADGGKTQAVKASAAGLAAAASAAPIVAVPRATVAAGTVFAVESGIPMPIVSRGNGETGSMYPFANLQVGDSFFVPETPTMPNPGKTLASAVSSAGKRYKDEQPPRVFTIRAGQIKDGVRGARIFRIVPPAPKAPAAPLVPAAPVAAATGFTAPA